MIKCQKCKMSCDEGFRHCPQCGTALFAPLDEPAASADSFIPLLNSLYNLLAVRSGEPHHPDRRKYFPELSEQVIIRRCRIEYDIDLRDISQRIILKGSVRPLWESNSLMEMYHLSLSQSLAGYTYRAVEEMICKTKCAPLSRSDTAKLVSSMREECALDTIYGYKSLCPTDPIDSRLLLCLGLRWDNRHKRYILGNETAQADWWNTVVEQSFLTSQNCLERVYRSLGLPSETQESVYDGLVQDLLHGYIVRLVESLDPI